MFFHLSAKLGSNHVENIQRIGNLMKSMFSGNGGECRLGQNLAGKIDHLQSWILRELKCFERALKWELRSSAV